MSFSQNVGLIELASISRESRPAEFPLLVSNRTPAEEAEKKLRRNIRTGGRGGKNRFSFACLSERRLEGWGEKGGKEGAKMNKTRVISGRCLQREGSSRGNVC